MATLSQLRVYRQTFLCFLSGKKKPCAHLPFFFTTTSHTQKDIHTHTQSRRANFLPSQSEVVSVGSQFVFSKTVKYKSVGFFFVYSSTKQCFCSTGVFFRSVIGSLMEKKGFYMEFLKNGVTFQQIMINVTLNLKLAVIGRTSLVRSVYAATVLFKNFIPVKLVARYIRGTLIQPDSR